MTYYAVAPQLVSMPASGFDLGTAGGLAMMGAAMSPASMPGSVAPPAIPVEAQRQQAAAVLQHCYRWLESAVPIVPQTAELVPVLVAAVQQYEAAQYDACLAQALAVVQTVRQLRMSVPALPPL